MYLVHATKILHKTRQGHGSVKRNYKILQLCSGLRNKMNVLVGGALAQAS